jgi:hypothetical protein
MHVIAALGVSAKVSAIFLSLTNAGVYFDPNYQPPNICT